MSFTNLDSSFYRGSTKLNGNDEFQSGSTTINNNIFNPFDPNPVYKTISNSFTTAKTINMPPNNGSNWVLAFYYQTELTGGQNGPLSFTILVGYAGRVGIKFKFVPYLTLESVGTETILTSTTTPVIQYTQPTVTVPSGYSYQRYVYTYASTGAGVWPTKGNTQNQSCFNLYINFINDPGFNTEGAFAVTYFQIPIQ